MFTRPQEPQSVGGVLDTGFRLFAAGIKAIVPIAYIGGILGGIWNWYIGTRAVAMQTGGVGSVGAFFAELLPGMIVMMALGALVMAAAISRTGAVFRGAESSFAQAFANGFRRWLAVFFAGILYTLAVMGGSILLVIKRRRPG